MHPPSRRVSWANPISSCNEGGSAKHSKRDDALGRLKKLTFTTTTTTTSMSNLFKLGKLKFALKPMKLSAHPVSHNSKCSKPVNYNIKGSNLNPVSYNNKGSSSMSWVKKGLNTKPMNTYNKGSSLKGDHLLAGYLAHEYLTKGTLMGKRWDQLPSQRVELKNEEKHQMYEEIAHLLKMDGAKMKGIVNPTQLAYSLRLS